MSTKPLQVPHHTTRCGLVGITLVSPAWPAPCNLAWFINWLCANQAKLSQGVSARGRGGMKTEDEKLNVGWVIDRKARNTVQRCCRSTSFLPEMESTADIVKTGKDIRIYFLQIHTHSFQNFPHNYLQRPQRWSGIWQGYEKCPSWWEPVCDLKWVKAVVDDPVKRKKPSEDLVDGMAQRPDIYGELEGRSLHVDHEWTIVLNTTVSSWPCQAILDMPWY